MISTKQINEKAVWINIDADIISARPELFETYQLDDEIVEYALDRNERARVEYNRERETFVVIYNVPRLVKQDRHYETVPMTFIVQPNRLITISNEANSYLLSRFHRYLEQYPDETVFNVLFSWLFIISEYYFPLVEEINKERDHISSLLRDKTTKQNLLTLSDLEMGMVYFVSATKQNAVVLEQLRTQAVARRFTEEEREQLEDALIEARQLVEMTQLTSQILNQLSGTYNNILNNNLNDTMKVLTVLSILLTIPTIITGYFGMNIPLPFEGDPAGWLYVIVISIFAFVVGSFVLDKLMNKN